MEAFEIGVSLALKDGISGSIERARQSVEDLQTAIRSSVVSMKDLREVGRKSGSIGIDQRSPKPFGKPAPQAAITKASIDARTSAPMPVVDAPRGAQPSGSVWGEQRDIHTALASELTPEEPPEEVDKFQHLPLPYAKMAYQETVLSTAPKLGKRNTAAFQTYADETRRGAAPPAPDLDKVTTFVDNSSYLVPRNEPEADGTGVPGIVGSPRLNGPGVGGGAKNGTRAGSHYEFIELNSMMMPDQSGTQKMGARLDKPLVNQPAAPGLAGLGAPDIWASHGPEVETGPTKAELMENCSTDARFYPTFRTGSAQACNMKNFATPQNGQRSEEPSKGDVYLDGLLVGRWMLRFLRREAERADAGPTGFDAKRSRLLPGVTVGG